MNTLISEQATADRGSASANVSNLNREVEKLVLVDEAFARLEVAD